MKKNVGKKIISLSIVAALALSLVVQSGAVIAEESGSSAETSVEGQVTDVIPVEDETPAAVPEDAEETPAGDEAGDPETEVEAADVEAEDISDLTEDPDAEIMPLTAADDNPDETSVIEGEIELLDDEIDDSLVDSVLDSASSVTQGGASSYTDGHYYHIDVRLDADFDYIYHDGVFTVITGTMLTVTKTWQGGVPNGMTSVTFYVYQDNGDGTSTQIYYDGDGLLTTESTRSGSGPGGGTVNNDPVTLVVTQANGWSGSLQLDSGNYVLVEQEIDGYTSDATYVTVDNSTGDQLNGSYYASTGHIDVAGVNWVVYEMNGNGTTSGYETFKYGYLDGEYYALSSDSTAGSGDYEFFLDNSNTHGGRGLKFLTSDSTIWLNLDYEVTYQDENGNDQTVEYKGTTFTFYPEEWQANNLCDQKDSSSTMRGVDLRLDGSTIMAASGAGGDARSESTTTITAAVTNVNESDDSIFLTGTKAWMDEEGNYEQDHENASEITLDLYRKTDETEEVQLTENVDYVVVWVGSVYYIWGSYDTVAGGYVGLPSHVEEEEDNTYTYRVDEEPIEDYATEITPVLREDGFWDNNIVNTLSPNRTYAFSIRKTDESGNDLTGAIFTLADGDENPLYFVVQNGTYVLSESWEAAASTYIYAGNTAISGLYSGTYTLTEITAPDEHYFSEGENVHTVVIDEDGNISMDGTALPDTNIATIANKEQGTPTLTKSVDHETDFNTDTIEYTVDVESVQGVHDLMVHDSLDNELSLDTDDGKYQVTVVLYPSQTDLEAGTNGTALTYGEDYVVTAVDKCTFPDEAENCTFEIDFSNYANALDQATADSILHIVYDCDVHTEGDSYDDDHVTLENVAHTTYSLHRSEDVEVDVDIYGFEIDKYTFDEGGAEIPVEGAVFRLTDSGNTPAYFLQETVDDTTIYLFEGWGTAPDGYTNDITTTGSNVKVEGFAGDPSNVYTLTEVTTPTGYVISTDSFTIAINADGEVYFNGEEAEDGHTVKVFNNPLLSISGEKTWDDNDNQDGKRDDVTIRLFANDSQYDEVTVTGEPDWSYEFTDLPTYQVNSNGTITKINYTVTEVDVDGYTQSWDTDHVNVTNTHTPETVSVSAEKIWEDDEDTYENRPDSIELQLYCDEEKMNGRTIILSVANDWTNAIEDLPRYHDEGTEYVYSLEEISVDGYDSEMTALEFNEQTNTYKYTFTNTLQTTEVSGTKTWKDANDQDGVRPASIVIHLLADGNEFDTATIGSADGWEYSFTDLPCYMNGREVTYTVTETDVDGNTIEGYTPEQEGYNFTNTHETDTISIEVTKTWDDADNQDGKRPDSVTVHLYADGVEVEKADVAPRQIGLWERLIRPLTSITKEENWTYTFEDLPKYAAGQEITYTLTEDEVTDYTSQVGSVTLKDGETDVYEVEITNTHELETITVELLKEWEDENNQDGIRPDSVTIELTGTDNSSQTVTLDATAGWTTTVNSLPKYVAGKEGEAVIYSVTTESWDLPAGHEGEEGYTASSGEMTAVAGKENVYSITVTNTHTPATVEVSGTKTWADNSNQDGKRPNSITVNLLADNEQTDSTEVTVSSADAEGKWTYSFTDLPKYKSGTAITYTVTEDAVTDYTTSISGYDITNSYTPAATTVTITMAWVDDNNRDGIRSTEMTVTLTGTDGQTYTVTLNDANNWTATVDVPVYYDNGTKITYSVSQNLPDGYAEAIDSGDGYNFTITNTHAPAMVDGASGTVTVKKVWDDADDQDGIRPDEIMVTVTGATESDSTAYVDSVTLSDNNSWQDTLTGLYVYEAGEEITYTAKESDFVITETRDTYYEPTYSGGADAASNYTFTVTNTHTPDTTSVDVQKVWNDDGNRDAMESSSVTVQLRADGADVTGKTVTLSDADVWKNTFTDLPKYDSGKEITYTVAETDTPDGYTVTQTQDSDGTWVLANNHESLLVSEVTIVKAWDDADDQDGIRPTSVKVELQSDGNTVTDKDGTTWIETLTENDVDADGNWTITVTDHPVYVNDHGTRITYTLHEDDVADGYTATNDSEVTITESAASDGSTVYTGTVTLTNSHTPELINDNTGILSVTLNWDDDDDIYGVRPDEVTLQLMADGDPVVDGAGNPVTITLTSADGWTGEFTDLDKYTNGGWEIDYTVQLVSDAGYYTYDNGVKEDNGDGTYSLIVTAKSALAFYPMDEEIVPGSDDETTPDTWLTQEQVREYEQIEIEMSTILPSLPTNLLAEGDYTLTFHNELETELVLDAVEDDFHVYIGGNRIDSAYYTVEWSAVSPLSLLSVSTDDCTFHVTLDLTALYNDSVITDDDLGVSTVRVFFYVDLEGAEVGHLYTSTAWYDLADAGEVIYTSDPRTVSVYIVADEAEPITTGTGGTGDTGSEKSGGTGTTTTHKTKTDDPMHTALWIALACLSLAAMVGGIAVPATYRRRRHHRR